MKKRFLSYLIITISILGLAGCSTGKASKAEKSNKTTESTTVEKKATDDEELAMNDAKILLNFLYQGKKSGELMDVTNKSSESIDSYVLDELEEKQNKKFKKGESENDYYLVLDESKYYAPEIVEDYAKAYLDQTKKIKFTVEKADISGKEATITVSYFPIASLEEVNPIGKARTELLGGFNEEDIIRKSQNKDTKTLKSLMTLKLYAIYYGEKDNEATKVPDARKMTFTMNKKGDHYMVNEDVISQLMKDSRAKEYNDDKGKTESSTNESTTESKSKDKTKDSMKEKSTEESSGEDKK